jgi:hypothetical protein
MGELKVMFILEFLGFKYPDKMAPLEREYRKYDRYGKLILYRDNYYYNYNNFFSQMGASIFVILLLFYGFPIAWWAVPFTVIYYSNIKEELIDKVVKRQIYDLIVNASIKDFHGIKEKTNLSNKMFKKALKTLIAEGELIGKISNNVFISAGDYDYGKEIQATISERQINRFKGILKIKRQVSIEQMAQLFELPENEIEIMIYEIVGAGMVNLSIKDEVVYIPEEQDVDSVIEDLDSAFELWEANVEKRIGKA